MKYLSRQCLIFRQYVGEPLDDGLVWLERQQSLGHPLVEKGKCAARVAVIQCATELLEEQTDPARGIAWCIQSPARASECDVETSRGSARIDKRIGWRALPIGGSACLVPSAGRA
jgi:hypothetical protein